MRFLEEARRRPASLADHLPWAALVAPGVVLNKDGSFLTALSVRGPDLESSTEDELMSVRARLNNALKRLGAGWCLHVEARRRPADPYPSSDMPVTAAALVDAERQAAFDHAEPAFETDFRLSLTWLPPADETRRVERLLFDGLAHADRDWRAALETFQRQADAIFDLVADTLPGSAAAVGDAQLLTWLHACARPRAAIPSRPQECPAFLDAALADEPLSRRVPRLGRPTGSRSYRSGRCRRRRAPGCSTGSPHCPSPTAGRRGGSASTRLTPSGRSCGCASAGSPSARGSRSCSARRSPRRSCPFSTPTRPARPKSATAPSPPWAPTPAPTAT